MTTWFGTLGIHCIEQWTQHIEVVLTTQTIWCVHLHVANVDKNEKYVASKKAAVK